MSNLMSRLTDARPARLDPAPGAGLDPAGIMAHPRPQPRRPQLGRPQLGRPQLGRPLTRRLVLAGVVPAVALATVAVVALPSNPPSPSAVTARDVLLVAAERAGAGPADEFRVTTRVVGENGREIVFQQIQHVSPDGRQPLSMDRMLIRAEVTTAELASAPVEPARLRGWLTDLIRRGGVEPSGHLLFFAGQSLVMNLPVTPQVRAAAYRMLAGLEGVRLLGEVADPRGRKGTAVAYDYAGPDGPRQTRLIIDLPAGQALAEESYSLRGGTASLERYMLVLSAYPTDRASAAPGPLAS
jgi:hypothetical protein